VSGRAIDRHEDAICAALDLHDRLVYESGDNDEVPFAYAVQVTAQSYGLTEERLDQLVRCWCGIAGIEVPA
jgi:hypothetical protein